LAVSTLIVVALPIRRATAGCRATLAGLTASVLSERLWGCAKIASAILATRWVTTVVAVGVDSVGVDPAETEIIGPETPSELAVTAWAVARIEAPGLLSG
jgi:hypothetical protein